MAPNKNRTGFLPDLLRNEAGNTLAIFAAALVPMLAIIGSGVELSRAYMAKTQLQNACDAGALAGRKALAETGQYGRTEQGKATTMFRANFDHRSYGLGVPNFTTRADDENNVVGTVSVPLPTVIMNFFNFETIDLEANCTAELQIANTDVMFVLDTTGSMASSMSGGGTRISGLRDAVRDFHLTLANAQIQPETRIRYGFVPYSTTVNARGLVSAGHMPASFFSSSAPFQTRRVTFSVAENVGTGSNTTTGREETNAQRVTQSACSTWATSSNTTGTPPATTVTSGYQLVSWTRTNFLSTTGTCIRRSFQTTNTFKQIFRIANPANKWRYEQATVNTTGLAGLGQVAYATDVADTAWVDTAGTYDVRQLAAFGSQRSGGITTTNSTWGGCLMERDTVRATSFNPIPAGALDLDINSEPDAGNPGSYWRPMWLDIAYDRNANPYRREQTGTTYYPIDYRACPTEMMAFREVDMTSATVPGWLNTYVNSLRVEGFTYHDVGMIWGARLSSPTGIFADIVDDRPDEQANRHIIYMTDGEMDANRIAYTAYGHEQLENRIAIAGTLDTGPLEAIHALRFRAACQEAKNEGYTIWVIGFGTTISDDLRNCSSGDRAFFAGNIAQLRSTFSYIASQVADLRLTQ
ncbi:hypothetical protein GRI97_13280 [Altererythrobacter xixiisoli]|uniref:Putative Flp pilus-assembly TadG-like N-terminal domain-containing protein n=1 Tax=Croceibacterium xixiisoli TaxID=1476466 RepID=A0A6I4TXJ8_9SPHN|nr:pilus assembly protein TadG-related protein [Croceibacterium xixiisoli]MXO99960.1 hypothetical protein [Croceibacterium xixiisoli]